MIDFVDILYVIIAVATVVITITVVWLSNEMIGLIKTIRRSSQDSEHVTKEIREKVMLISESLDRAGSAASSLVGLMEDAVESIKPRREKIAESLGVIAGAANHAQSQQKKESRVEIKKDKPEEKDKEAEKEKSDKKSIPEVSKEEPKK